MGTFDCRSCVGGFGISHPLWVGQSEGERSLISSSPYIQRPSNEDGLASPMYLVDGRV